MLLQFVPADQVRDVWPWIVTGLQEVRDRCGEKWWPEDVYAALRGGSSYLYVVEDKGFYVFQNHADADGPVLFIWICWGELAPMVDELIAEIETLARNGKCKRIRMHSPRNWGKYFLARSTIYEKEL